MKGKGFIISGFPRIGKSTLAKNTEGVVDLADTPFKEDWSMYIDVVEYLANDGYIVLVSSNDNVRREMMNRGLDYTLVMPLSDDKKSYLYRCDIDCELGYMREDDFKSLKANWDIWTNPEKWLDKEYLNSQTRIIILPFLSYPSTDVANYLDQEVLKYIAETHKYPNFQD